MAQPSRYRRRPRLRLGHDQRANDVILAFANGAGRRWLPALSFVEVRPDHGCAHSFDCGLRYSVGGIVAPRVRSAGRTRRVDLWLCTAAQLSCVDPLTSEGA